MVNYRRNKPPERESTFFFTLCTSGRTKRFQRDEHFRILRNTLIYCEESYGVSILAWVFLPEHLHLLLTPNEADYSQVIRQFKRKVSALYQSDERRLADKLWQDRFWEHTIRNEDDIRRCTEYIHWNAVKHGLVSWPEEWPYSSYHSFVAAGLYPQGWCPSIEPHAAGAEWD